MKIFITGGTGFIGKYLVERLLQTEYKLKCLARRTSNKQFLKNAGVDIFIGDVTDKSSLQKGMEDCDYVVHLARSFVFHSETRKGKTSPGNVCSQQTKKRRGTVL